MTARPRSVECETLKAPTLALDLAAFLTVGLLTLTESFVELPAAVVAFGAARYLVSSSRSDGGS